MRPLTKTELMYVGSALESVQTSLRLQLTTSIPEAAAILMRGRMAGHLQAVLEILATDEMEQPANNGGRINATD